MKQIFTFLLLIFSLNVSAQVTNVTEPDVEQKQNTVTNPPPKTQTPVSKIPTSGVKVDQKQPVETKPNANKKTSNSTAQKQNGSASHSGGINVSTERQFLNALGSNRTIIIQKSINLSTITENELVIKNYSNLTIRGVNASIRLGVSRGENLVLSFESCKNITISNLIMGHEDVLWCGAGVLSFEYCSGVNISNCDIYGCGYYGIVLSHSNNVTCTNSNIHNCHLDMLEVSNSTNVKFRNTVFKDSTCGTIISVSSSKQIEFEKCSFIDRTHTGQEMYGHKCFALDSYIKLKNCTINYTNTYGDTNYIRQERCKWY